MIVSVMFAYRWHHVVLWLAQCLITVGTTLTYGSCNVGLWLAQRGLVVGAMLDYG